MDVDLNKETVAIISGEVISSGEVVTGQFSEVAYCKGGLIGLLSDFAAVASSTNISLKSMPVTIAPIASKHEGISMVSEDS